MQLIEWYSRKHRLVTRSTWAAELYTSVDGVDFLMVLGSAFTELITGVKVGTSGLHELMQLRERGGHALPLQLVTDSMSIFTATDKMDRLPAEANTVHHLQWLQELTRKTVLACMWWVDTRDMLADAMNKGSVSKDDLIKAQNTGMWTVIHPAKRLPPLRGTASTATT